MIARSLIASAIKREALARFRYSIPNLCLTVPFEAGEGKMSNCAVAERRTAQITDRRLPPVPSHSQRLTDEMAANPLSDFGSTRRWREPD